MGCTRTIGLNEFEIERWQKATEVRRKRGVVIEPSCDKLFATGPQVSRWLTMLDAKSNDIPFGPSVLEMRHKDWKGFLRIQAGVNKSLKELYKDGK